METIIDINNPNFHPACLLFPRLPEDELHALAEDIKQNGLHRPIVILNGEILDGRNRLEACKIAGVEPRFVEWHGDGSPVAWTISENVKRRHLTASQRAVVAFGLLPLLEAEAKERQRLSKGRGKKGAQPCANSTGKASEHAARLANSAARIVEQVKSIHKQAPELIEEIRGGMLTVADAAKLSTLPKARRETVLEQAQKPKANLRRLIRQAELDHQQEKARKSARKKEELPRVGDVQIWCGDCLSMMRDQLEPRSVDVVVTSAPYNIGVKYGCYDDNRDEDDYLRWLDDVFETIKAVLKDDGSFFLNVGSTHQKPWTAMRVAEIASWHFRLQNEINWVKAITVEGRSHGHFTPVNSERFLHRNWEHVFHFTKTRRVVLDRLAIGVEYSDKNNLHRNSAQADLRCGGDVWFIPHRTTQNRGDKGFHPCPFPVELPERCIRLHGISEGMVVLDPFNGVGNSTLAMARLGVKGVGIDLDADYCRVAHNRLAADYEAAAWRKELTVIIEDSIDLGSVTTQQQVRKFWMSATDLGNVAFPAALGSLPEKYRTLYDRLPNEAA